MKKFMIYLMAAVLAFAVAGCSRGGDEDVVPTPIPEIDDNYEKVTGSLGIMTEAVQLKDPYIITADASGNTAQEDFGSDYQLNANDMVIIIDETDTEYKVIPISIEQLVPRGTVDKNTVSLDTALFETNSNQAMANGIPAYDNENGTQTGTVIGTVQITERRGDWVLAEQSGEAGSAWFKAEELSYDFPTVTISE